MVQKTLKGTQSADSTTPCPFLIRNSFLRGVTLMPVTQSVRYIHTYLHPFNGPLSGTTWVSQYQKGKTNLDFTDARDSEWQWYQLGHMQVCSLLQSDNHASTPPLSFFTGRVPFLPPNQQCQARLTVHTRNHCD